MGCGVPFQFPYVLKGWAVPKYVLDIAIGRPTVATSGCVSVTKLVERSAGPHGVTSNAFQRVFLVFGAFLNSSVVDMLINFV